MSTSVNIVAHKQVVRFRNFASDFKEFHEVVKLSVDVATDNDWSSNGDDVGFFSQDLFGLGRL